MGWPDKRDECPMTLRDFWGYRDELSILNGLVLKGTRIIVPKSCHDEVHNYRKVTLALNVLGCEQGTVFTGC